LRIVQIGLGEAVARDHLEAVGIAARQDRHERREGLGINLANVVMGQSFGKARTLVGVTRFVAIRPVRRNLFVEIRLRRRLTDAEGCHLAC
jgi:hypothetical protein